MAPISKETREALQKVEDARIAWEIIYSKGAEVDPHDDYIWEGVLLGFLLGRGLPLSMAQSIARGAPHNDWSI